MIHKSPLKPSELQPAWDLLCNPQNSPFRDERNTCLDLLNKTAKKGLKEPLNDHLQMMTNDCLPDLLWLATQNEALMSYCCNEPSVQEVWENYLNKILLCNDSKAKVNTQAHQPLFLTVMGQCIAFQSSDHVHSEGLLKGLLNDEGIALLQLSLHYQSIYGAEFMLYHMVSLHSPPQLAEQFNFFPPLIEVHGAPGARACALAYWIYTTKFNTDDLSDDDTLCLEIALKKVLVYSKIAELLIPYSQADWTNSAFLSQTYWPLNFTNFDLVLTALEASYPDQLSDEMLCDARQQAIKTSQEWISTHLHGLQENFDDPEPMSYSI